MYIRCTLHAISLLLFASILITASGAHDRQWAEQARENQGIQIFRSPSLQSLIEHIPTKRDEYEADELTIGSIRILSSSVPIQTAVQSLELFYNQILYNARVHWIGIEPQFTLQLNVGCLQLTMSIAFNHGVVRGIPWSFVRNFARNMLVMTRSGFTGTYNMLYLSRNGAFNPVFGVDVSFRVLWECIGPPQSRPPDRSQQSGSTS